MTPLAPEHPQDNPSVDTQGPGATFQRDTAIDGTADDNQDDATNDGHSAPEPAEGRDDAPPPQPGSPRRSE